MSLTLYHVQWCPECEMVRRKLAELNLPYEDVVVPDLRPLRKEVFAVSGQYYVPVLQDGDTVLSETREILDHLDTRSNNAGMRQEARGEGEEGQDQASSCRL
jgi:glutathione S-transferase